MSEAKRDISEQVHHHDRQRLRALLGDARQGFTLRERQRFDAAFELGKRYNAIIREVKGGRSAFEGRVIEILDEYGHRTETFDVAKWKLPKGVEQVDTTVRSNPKYRSIPQKSLIHYLSAIQALAEFAGEDIENALISFLKAARMWKDEPLPDSGEDNWDAISRLHHMLTAVCQGVAAQTGMMDVFRRLYSMPLTWRYLEQRLQLGTISNFAGGFSPVDRSPLFDVNIDETFPFPSVPLLRIPLAWGDLAVEIEEGKTCIAAEPGAARRDGIFKRRDARVIQYRDIHLAIAPLNDREVGPVLMSRGLVGLRIPSSSPHVTMVFGTLHWLDTLAVQQEVLHDGGWRRIKLEFDPDQDRLDHQIAGPGDDYSWECDPVEYPGVLNSGGDYVVYHRMSVDHLHHWLIGDHALDGEGATCPWSPFDGEPWTERPGLVLPPTGNLWEDAFHDADGKALPLLSPVRTSAFYVEAALHKGRIHKALLDQATALRRQAVHLVEQRRIEAIAAQEQLMASWKSAQHPHSLEETQDKGTRNDTE